MADSVSVRHVKFKTENCSLIKKQKQMCFKTGVISKKYNYLIIFVYPAAMQVAV